VISAWIALSSGVRRRAPTPGGPPILWEERAREWQRRVVRETVVVVGPG
jgi:hypothetical protein